MEFSYESGLPEDISVAPDIAIIIYRVLQECLTNIIKHSEASNAEIHLSLQDDFLVLEVRDDGVGFDPVMTWILKRI